ncbi:MAG: winged helix-turn-helix transcriptional regulator [Lachnospiraceae bacterium]
MIKQCELPACPVEMTLALMGDRWKILIVRDLLDGTMRFGELKKSLTGISQKVLTQHLRIMEENGLIHREVYAQVPPKVEYSLTELGQSLRLVHDAMHAWGQAYKDSFSEV